MYYVCNYMESLSAIRSLKDYMFKMTHRNCMIIVTVVVDSRSLTSCIAPAVLTHACT